MCRESQMTLQVRWREHTVSLFGKLHQGGHRVWTDVKVTKRLRSGRAAVAISHQMSPDTCSSLTNWITGVKTKHSIQKPGREALFLL